MHLSIAVLICIVLFGAVLETLSFFWAVKLFKLKPKPEARKKLLYFIAGFNVLESASSAFGGASVIGGLVSALGFIAGFFLWAWALKYLKVRGYTNARAIGSYLFANIVAAVVAVVFALIVVTAVVRVYAIDGPTMEPALHENDHVLVLKYARRPAENDVVVYRTLEGKRAIGRIHAVPGQSIVIPASDVFVDGKPVTAKSFKLDDDQYYVSGDNSKYPTTRIIEAKTIIGTVGPKL